MHSIHSHFSETWTVIVIMCWLTLPSEAVTTFENGVVVVEERVGGSLVLPCDVTPPLGDTVAVILWYRDHLPKAVYTYDARNSSLGFQQHTPRDPALAPRATFRPRPPASLTLSPALITDSGTYQCRADFANSPSRTTVVKTVVVAEVAGVVLERLDGSSGVLKKDGIILPGGIVTVRLGESLLLQCCARGGFPAPRVWWRLNNQSLDTTYTSHQPTSHNQPSHLVYTQRATCNDLALVNVTRDYDQARLHCEASNSNHSSPVQESVLVMVQSPPSAVVLKGVPETFEAGRVYRLACEVLGARPRPLLTWTMTRVQETSRVVARQDLRKLSVGRYDIKFTKADEGAALTCTAVSPAFREQPVAAAVNVTVHYAPLVRLELGALLEAGSVREGTDLYFRCIVDAAPLPYRLDWWHENRQISNDGQSTTFNKVQYNASSHKLHFTTLRQSSEHPTQFATDGASVDLFTRATALGTRDDTQGSRNHSRTPSRQGVGAKSSHQQGAGGGGTRVVVSNDHLVLQRVGKEWTGNFSCSANNVVGDAVSNAIQIIVQYPPLCAWSTPRVVRASLGEPLQLPCTVHALPSQVTFSWTFSNSLSQERITSMTRSSDGLGEAGSANSGSSSSSSVLQYRPLTQQDYGTVLCWAQNEVGKQQEPCVYSIRPAPELLSPPPQCAVISYSPNSLKVKCTRQQPVVNSTELADERVSVPAYGTGGSLTYTQVNRMQSTQQQHEKKTRYEDPVKKTQDRDSLDRRKFPPLTPYTALENTEVHLQQEVSTALENSEEHLQQEVRQELDMEHAESELDNEIQTVKSDLPHSSHHNTNDGVDSANNDEVKQQASKGAANRGGGKGDRRGTVNSQVNGKGVVLPFFVITVREQDTNQLVQNETSFDGEFALTGLSAGVGYSLAVTAVGERGVRSPPTPFKITTPLHSSHPSNRPSIFPQSHPDAQIIISGIITGIVIIVIIVITTAILRRKRQRRRRRPIRHDGSDSEDRGQMETSCSIAKDESDENVGDQQQTDTGQDDTQASLVSHRMPTPRLLTGGRECCDKGLHGERGDGGCRDGEERGCGRRCAEVGETSTPPDLLEEGQQLINEIFQMAPLRPRPAAPSKPGVRFADEQPLYDSRGGHQDRARDLAELQPTPTQILSQVQGEIVYADNNSQSVMGVVAMAEEVGRTSNGISCSGSGTHSLDLGLFGHPYSPPPQSVQTAACNCQSQVKQIAQVPERPYAGCLGSTNYNYHIQELAFPKFPYTEPKFTSCSAIRPPCQQGLPPVTFYCSETSTLPRKSSQTRLPTASEESSSKRSHRTKSGTRSYLSQASTPSLSKSTSILELRCLEEYRRPDRTTSQPPEVLGRVSSLMTATQASPTYVNTLVET